MSSKIKGCAMKLYGSEGILLMEVESLTASGRNINIKGKMMGQVPMQVVLGPRELRQTLRMLSFSVVWQGLRMLFLRSEPR
jgi:hypothetical protein